MALFTRATGIGGGGDRPRDWGAGGLADEDERSTVSLRCDGGWKYRQLSRLHRPCSHDQ